MSDRQRVDAVGAPSAHQRRLDRRRAKRSRPSIASGSCPARDRARRASTTGTRDGDVRVARPRRGNSASSKPLRGPRTGRSASPASVRTPCVSSSTADCVDELDGEAERHAERDREHRDQRPRAVLRERAAQRRRRRRRPNRAPSRVQSGRGRAGRRGRARGCGPAVRRRRERMRDQDARPRRVPSPASRSSASTDAALSGSRLPVGSSASTSLGRCTSARAIATRCSSPPDSSRGSELRALARDRRREHRRPSALALGRPRRRAATAAARRSARTVRYGSTWNAWNTKPIRSRRSTRQRVVVERGQVDAVEPDRPARRAGRARRSGSAASTCRRPTRP